MIPFYKMGGIVRRIGKGTGRRTGRGMGRRTGRRKGSDMGIYASLLK